MTSYVARKYPAKRFDRLKKWEKRLVHCISALSTDDELKDAAEKVREAKLILLKGQRYYAMQPAAIEKINFEQLQMIDAETAAWEQKSVEEIIQIYKGSNPQDRNVDARRSQ